MKKTPRQATIDDTLSSVLDPERRKLRLRHSFVSVAVFSLVCAGREGELASAKELAEIREADTRFRELQKQIETVGHDSAKEEIAAVRAAYEADPSPVNFQKLREVELVKEQLRWQHSEMRRTIKEAMRTFCLNARTLAVPVLIRALAMVDLEAAALSAAEEKTATRFGVPFSPSCTLQSLSTLGFHIEDLIEAAAGEQVSRMGVRQILAGILKF